MALVYIYVCNSFGPSHEKRNKFPLQLSIVSVGLDTEEILNQLNNITVSSDIKHLGVNEDPNKFTPVNLSIKKHITGPVVLMDP